MYVRTAFTLMSIKNFMAHLESMFLEKENLIKFSGKLKLDTQFRNLYNVKDKMEFDYWENNQYLGGSMKSMSVGKEPPINLEELF